MNGNKKGIFFTVISLFAIGALFLGIFVSQHMQDPRKIDVADFHGTYLEKPRAINQFSLTGMDQKTFDNASLQGHWTMVFFGFTNCGYLCPTTLAELGKMYRQLETEGVKNLPQVVMISIDPDRDKLEKLSQYMTSFHPSFYGARGDESSIKAMTREMGIAYVKMLNKDNPKAQNYDIQHSGAVMLFNPKGELNAFFTSPHHADLLVKDYMLLQS